MANSRRPLAASAAVSASRNGTPRSSVNFGSTKPDSSAAEPLDEVRDLLRRTDADEQQRQLRIRTAISQDPELPDQVLLCARNLRVVYGVLQAQHHRDDAAVDLLHDVLGQPRSGRGAVQRGAEGHGEHPGRGFRGEDTGFLMEEALPHLRSDVPEMTHVTPGAAEQPDDMWPVIVRRDPCPGFPPGMKFRLRKRTQPNTAISSSLTPNGPGRTPALS
jgi:hypothetical protein